MTLPVPHVPPGAHLLESDFQEQLRRALCAPGRNTRVWRQNSGSVTLRDEKGRARGQFRGAVVGAGDLSGICDGGLRLEVEVKVKKPWSAEQRTFYELIKKFGGIYVVIRYRSDLTLSENVERGVRLVDEAIAARVCVPDEE